MIFTRCDATHARDSMRENFIRFSAIAKHASYSRLFAIFFCPFHLWRFNGLISALMAFYCRDPILKERKNCLKVQIVFKRSRLLPFYSMVYRRKSQLSCFRVKREKFF